MARFLLVRHGHTEVTGRVISGRTPGVHLSAKGRDQAQRLVPLLARYRVDQIVVSPMERTRETAQPLAEHQGLTMRTEPDVNEVDFGQWQGRAEAELRDDEGWRRFNTFRSAAPTPGGETMHQVQARMVSAMIRLHEANRESAIAVFSHGDPLKTVVCHYGCIPLDCMLRFDLDPASVTVLDVGDHGSVIRFMNCAPP